MDLVPRTVPPQTVLWTRASTTDPPAGPGSSIPLTTSRVRPPAPGRSMIERPRLLHRVSRAVADTPLTLLRAPAGYGKTVLAAAWAHAHGLRRPVAWLTLSERDEQPGVFWSHVVLALTLVGAVTADVTRPLLPDPYDGDELGEFLLVAGGPVVLILDAAERLTNKGVFTQLDRLLDNVGERLRVLVTTRVDPPMPLHRYRLEGTVSEIGFEELAFTAEESHELLERQGASDSAPDDRQWAAEVEGWPAGVRMAALATGRGAADEHLREWVADYLSAEVLADLTESDRELLLKVSLVDELPAGLAAALSDRVDADDALRRMSTANTFVQPLTGRAGYRLPHPVRRFLADRQTRTDPALAADVHRRAADWFAAHGRLRAAVGHASAVQDWDRAAGFVIARLHQPSGDVTEALLAAQAVRARIAAEVDDTDRDRRLLQARLLYAEGTARLRAGELDAACAALHQASTSAAVADRAELRIDAVASLALAEACRGHLAAAQGLALEADRLAGDRAATALQPRAASCLAQGWAALDGESLRKAQDLLGQAARLRETGEDAFLRSVSLLLRARLLRERGDPARARQLLERLDPAMDWLRPRLLAETHSTPTAPTPVVAELSKRELEVLRQLSALLTTEEIAAQLFISVNTVRTHIRRILEKLSVSRRNEAVRRARALGLV